MNSHDRLSAAWLAIVDRPGLLGSSAVRLGGMRRHGRHARLAAAASLDEVDPARRGSR